MATLSGRNAKVELYASPSSDVVAELGNWSIAMSQDVIDTTAFGTTWKKSDRGMTGWTATVTGYRDNTDTSGQSVLQTAFFSGTLITNIRFYTTAAKYYTMDPSSASAGCYITAWSVGTDKAGVAELNFTCMGVGALTEV